MSLLRTVTKILHSLNAMVEENLQSHTLQNSSHVHRINDRRCLADITYSREFVEILYELQ